MEYNDLIGEILKASGEKDRNSNKGKPLSQEFLNMDTFQNFQKKAKDAGYLPYWLVLQKEISVLIQSYKTDEDLTKINEKIREYNKICPNSLQRNLINDQNLKKAIQIWK